MRSLLRVLAALVLVGNTAVVVTVLARLVPEAPGWVALHYAPMAAEDRCDATVARLRAVIRQRTRRDPSPEDEAALERLRASGACDVGSPEVRAIEARLAPATPQ